MAEMTIRLRVNPQTGKKDILVDLRSDQDSLPHEHEQQHRMLVEKLIEGGLASADEIGDLIVQREETASEPGDMVASPEPERQSHQSEN